MRRVVEILAGFALAVVGAVFAFLLVEGGVRALHLVPDRFWQPDAKMGVRLVPGKRGWWTQEEREFVVPVTINAQGLRDVPHTYEKSPGIVRVLIVGDSFVEAMHVPLEEVFTRRLERLLDGVGASRKVEVIGAGVSGWGTASQLLWLQEEGYKYRPDVVLLHFYPGNDIKNNSPTLEDALPPVYDADGTLLSVQSRKADNTVRQGWFAWSKAYVFLRQLLLRQPTIAQTLGRLGVVRVRAPVAPAVRDGLPLDFGVYRVPPETEWLEAWQHTQRLLSAMRDAVREMGAAFGVVMASSREQVYPAAWDRILETYPTARALTFDLDQPQRWVEQWCQQQGVPYVALAPAFRARAATGGEPLHFWYDGHWTSAGHRVAAEEIRKFLVANFSLS